jgi:hypothetical protein
MCALLLSHGPSCLLLLLCGLSIQLGRLLSLQETGVLPSVF